MEERHISLQSVAVFASPSSGFSPIFLDVEKHISLDQSSRWRPPARASSSCLALLPGTLPLPLTLVRYTKKSSIRALPAAAPEAGIAARQIELKPPSYTVTWETQQPAPTEPPSEEDPDEDEPVPAPNDSISLSPPSFTVSWDAPLPTADDPEPEDPEPEEPGDDDDYPVPQPPKPSDSISLSPPSYTVSWDPPLPTTTKKPEYPGWPWRPRPTKTKKTTSKPSVTATVTWGRKRQFDYDPIPTDVGEDPEDPEDPEESDFPSPDPEEGDLPNFPIPTQKDSIGITPPKATISWGKREEEADNPPPTIGLGKPTATLIWPKPVKPTGHISWGKRQEDEVTINPPEATIIWGK